MSIAKKIAAYVLNHPCTGKKEGKAFSELIPFNYEGRALFDAFSEITEWGNNSPYKDMNGSEQCLLMLFCELYMKDM